MRGSKSNYHVEITLVSKYRNWETCIAQLFLTIIVTYRKCVWDEKTNFFIMIQFTIKVNIILVLVNVILLGRGKLNVTVCHHGLELGLWEGGGSTTYKRDPDEFISDKDEPTDLVSKV